MQYDTRYVFPLIIAAVVSATIAFAAWRRRRAPGATPLAALMLAVAGWSLGYALELSSPVLADKVVWAQWEYAGIVSAPVAWLCFVVEYTGRERWLRPRTLLALALVPCFTLLLTVTNAAHGLIWRDVVLDTRGPIPMLDVSYGRAFWLHVAYSYLLMLLGAALLLRTIVRSPQQYRKQAVPLLLAVAAPWLGNVLYLAELTPLYHLDLTPFAFMLTGLLFSWSLLRSHLLDLVPVARGALLDNMADGVIVLSAANEIVDLNGAARRILGRPGEPLIGRPAREVLAAWPDLLERYRGVTAARDEITLGAPEAPAFYELEIAPLRGRSGELTGRLVMLHDVTARKRDAELLRQLYDEQRQLSAQLLSAKESAEAANLAKSDFISFVSHELRTPMTAIKGYVDLMRLGAAGPVNELQESFLGTIRMNVDLMAALVSDIADTARIEAGRLKLEYGSVPAGELIEKVVQSARGQIESKAQTLSVRAPADLPPAWADRTRLTQILTNLVSNANKYTPNDGQITILAETVAEQDREMLHIAVQDTGMGISEDDQPKIFQLFFRATDDVTRSIPGTGLGLAITRSLVELQGGRIWFESQVGQGTTFHFTIPVAAEPIANDLELLAGVADS
jgi:PAS domain S-box-containing protein